MSSRPIVFALIALLQLAVPGWMVVHHSRVQRDGEVFLFKTAPVDPTDPFRGEYVVLSFEAANGSWPAEGIEQDEAYTEQPYFAVLGRDPDGYAVITHLLTEPPASGAYIEVVAYASGDRIHNVTLPFDRFYMEEGEGGRTEDLLSGRVDPWLIGLNDRMGEPLPAHAVVRVLGGDAVIDDLIVGNRSIHEWLKEQPAPSE